MMTTNALSRNGKEVEMSSCIHIQDRINTKILPFPAGHPQPMRTKFDRCQFCRHTDRQKVTIYSLIRRRFSFSSIVHSFIYFVDFIVLGYELTLGTT